MTNYERVPEFGERVFGVHYVRRPGSYGLAFDDTNKVCLMRIQVGYFILGGGADSGETEEETLTREVREECGHAVEIVRRIGVAIQNVLAEGEGYFAKRVCILRIAVG